MRQCTCALDIYSSRHFPHYAVIAVILENYSDLLKTNYDTNSETTLCRVGKQSLKMQHMF